MANALYTAYKQVLLGDNAITGFSVPDLEGGDQRLILVDSADYTPNINADDALNDIPAAGRVATVALSGQSVSASGSTVTFTASNATFTAVSGDQSELLVIYNHTGTESTSLLLVLFDTFTSGMPVTPNGGDIIVQWNASGIFSI